MIRHILSMLGCGAGIVLFIIFYFFAVRNRYDVFWLKGIVGFLILLGLVYWNLKIEEKKKES